ncbi:MAG: Acetate permease ActP (cation/acetate symporter), partial [uncultured Adhaeribacter sp.]
VCLKGRTWRLWWDWLFRLRPAPTFRLCLCLLSGNAPNRPLG